MLAPTIYNHYVIILCFILLVLKELRPKINSPYLNGIWTDLDSKWGTNFVKSPKNGHRPKKGRPSSFLPLNRFKLKVRYTYVYMFKIRCVGNSLIPFFYHISCAIPFYTAFRRIILALNFPSTDVFKSSSILV